MIPPAGRRTILSQAYQCQDLSRWFSRQTPGPFGNIRANAIYPPLCARPYELVPFWNTGNTESHRNFEHRGGSCCLQLPQGSISSCPVSIADSNAPGLPRRLDCALRRLQTTAILAKGPRRLVEVRFLARRRFQNTALQVCHGWFHSMTPY